MRQGEDGGWDLGLSRRLTDIEIKEANELLAIVDIFNVSEEDDRRIWGEGKEDFSA
ncbi:hypothetical protein ACHQM5_026678 [Ranunculus cassubicifolius]